MDKNSNAKQSTKKSSASVDKNRKSGNKKKKKSKKPLSAKSDQSPDQLEVEGVRALDQNGEKYLTRLSYRCGCKLLEQMIFDKC